MKDILVENGKKMRFYVSPMPGRGSIMKLIEKYGGEVVKDKNELTNSLDIVCLTAKKVSSGGVPLVHVSFLHDSISNATLQDLGKYSTLEKKPKPNERAPAPKVEEIGEEIWDEIPLRRAYTSEDEAKIISFLVEEIEEGKVRVVEGKEGKIAFRISNVTWKEMESAKVACHSWESLKNHFKREEMRDMLRSAIKRTPDGSWKRKKRFRLISAGTAPETVYTLNEARKKRKVIEETPLEEEGLDYAFYDEIGDISSSIVQSQEEERRHKFDFESPEELKKLVTEIAKEIGVKEDVVVYSIYVNNGSVEDAYLYLKGKKGPKWSLHEDSILLDNSQSNTQEDIVDLVDKKGEDAVEERIRYLQGEYEDEQE